MPNPSGCVHVMVEVNQLTDVGRAYNRLKAQGVKLMATLGEHENDRMTRSEEHTSELQSLMRISYAVFCLKKKKNDKPIYLQQTPLIITHRLTNTLNHRITHNTNLQLHQPTTHSY